MSKRWHQKTPPLLRTENLWLRCSFSRQLVTVLSFSKPKRLTQTRVSDPDFVGTIPTRLQILTFTQQRAVRGNKRIFDFLSFSLYNNNNKSFGDRLMAGQLVLVQFIRVRILVPEQRNKKQAIGLFFVSFC